MQKFLLAALLLCVPIGGQAQTADPARVTQAVEELKEAFSSNKTEDRLLAIQKHRKVIDVQVADALIKGLKDSDVAVQKATIEGLRWMHYPSALKALHKSLKSDKRLRKNPALFMDLLRAVGQHANPESIELLMDGALSPRSIPEFKARLFSIAHIRHIDSVAATMKLLQRRAGLPNPKGNFKQLQELYDIALESLTGQTFTGDDQAWLRWWKKNKKTFKVSTEQVKLTPKTQKVWTTYWSKPKMRRAGTDKNKRGNQPKRK